MTPNSEPLALTTELYNTFGGVGSLASRGLQ